MTLERHKVNMQKTSDWMWKEYFSRGKSEKGMKIAKGQERINELAKSNFKKEFMEKYKDTKIAFKLGSGRVIESEFTGFKFDSNYGSYHLGFKNLSRSEGKSDIEYFHIKDDNNGIPYLGTFPENYYQSSFDLTEDSRKTLIDMLSHGRWVFEN